MAGRACSYVSPWPWCQSGNVQTRQGYHLSPPATFMVYQIWCTDARCTNPGGTKNHDAHHDGIMTRHLSVVRCCVLSCQVVSLHCNLDATTHHLMNAERLKMMKPNSVLVNAARGQCIDETALVAHLKANPEFRWDARHSYSLRCIREPMRTLSICCQMKCCARACVGGEVVRAAGIQHWFSRGLAKVMRQNSLCAHWM